MTRPIKEAYDLSDAEKRDLIALIQQGKPLPEKYRFVLFEDKREVELVWNGKTRDVCTTILPSQTLEHIDEPRTETHGSGHQEDLFDPRRRPKGQVQFFNIAYVEAQPRYAKGRRAKALHPDAQPGRYTVAVKVIDIFGNDTMLLVPVNVG